MKDFIKMKSLKFKVAGMHCPGCVTSVKEALLSAPGISKAEVDISNDTATVEFFENQTTVDKLVSIIENSGFKAEPIFN